MGAGPDPGGGRNLFHFESQFRCTGTGSHLMAFNRGGAEISNIFSSSKIVYMNTPVSQTVPEEVQDHFEEIGAVIFCPFIVISGS